MWLHCPVLLGWGRDQRFEWKWWKGHFLPSVRRITIFWVGAQKAHQVQVLKRMVPTEIKPVTLVLKLNLWKTDLLKAQGLLKLHQTWSWSAGIWHTGGVCLVLTPVRNCLVLAFGSNAFSPTGPWQRRDADTWLCSLSCRWCVMRMALRATPLCTLRPRMLQIGPSRRWTACCSTTAKCECHRRQQQRSHAPGCISVLTGTHKALVLLAQALACYLSTPGLVSDPAQAMACYPSIPGLVGFPDQALICHLSASGLGWVLSRASGSPWPATAQVIFLVGLWAVCCSLLSPFLVPIPSSYCTLIFFFFLPRHESHIFLLLRPICLLGFLFCFFFILQICWEIQVS